MILVVIFNVLSLTDSSLMLVLGLMWISHLERTNVLLSCVFRKFWFNHILPPWDIFTSRKVIFEHQAIVSELGSIGPFGHHY
jgi:hypothetical protein